MNGIASDLRHALRRIRAAPAHAAALVAMLALGIGVSVAMFSVLDGVLLDGLPYPGGTRVVHVHADNPSQSVQRGNLTPAEAERFGEADGPFEAFGYYGWGGVTLYDGSEPRESTISRVGPGFFDALGVAPRHGRLFAAEAWTRGDDDSVVLGWTEFQRLLGGDPARVGSTIRTADGDVRVIGVMPPEFTFPSPRVGLWRIFPPANLDRADPGYYRARYLDAVARLPGQRTPSAVAERMGQLAGALREAGGLPDDGWTYASTPLIEDLVGGVRGTLWGAFAVALLVLLVACANAALLLDARHVARRHQDALVQALGASRLRVARTQALELGLVTALALALGAGLAWLAIELLRELASGSLPRADEIVLDRRGLAFALALAAVVPLLALAFGALRVRASAAESLRGGGRGMIGLRRPMRLLPAAGVALSTVGLVCALALVASLLRLGATDPGYRSERVFALQMFRDGPPAEWRRFSQELLPRLAALPGVEQAALSTSTPNAVIGDFRTEVLAGPAEVVEPIRAGQRRVSPGFRELLGIPLLAGRDLDASDREGGERVALVNATLARLAFPDGNAVGQRINVPDQRGEAVWHRVVGITADIRNRGLRAPPAPELLVPFEQSPWIGMSFLVRGSSLEPGVLRQMTTAMWEVAPDEAVTRSWGIGEDLEAQLTAVRFFSRTVGSFALAALLLAAFGVYAVVALVQRQREAEYGLRLALGARPFALARRVLGEGARLALLGIAAGLVLAGFAMHLVSAQLYGVEASGALPYLASAFAMGLAVLAAAGLPALRAAATQPMRALRWE